MKHEAQVCSILALKTSKGAWVLDAQEKADLFADTFAGKSKLPRLCRNSYTECAQSLELQAAVACPTVEQRVAVLAGLRVDRQPFGLSPGVYIGWYPSTKESRFLGQQLQGHTPDRPTVEGC